jgi:hypothetical protein
MSQMSPAHRPASIHDLLAGLLVAVFLLQSFFASLQKSPVYDEPPHIASGLSYLATGVFRANLQHPPLLKEMSALFLRAAGIEWPRTEEARALIRGAPEAENYEWPLGNEIIASNGPDRVMFWARLPFTLLAGLLAVLIYVWGRELAGPAAAQGALFLYALDPTILAHSFLVTTDVGLAAFSMLFLWTVWRYVERPGRRRLAICGLAMGAMLGTKFSALFMAASASILMLAAVRWPLSQADAAAAEAEPRSAKAGPNSPCPCGSGRKYKRCHGVAGSARPAVATSPRTRKMLERIGAFLAMCVLAALVVEALYFFPRDPFLYLEGLKKVNADHPAGYQYYFHGDTSTRFYGYFVAAYLLKEPLATIVLAAAGLWALVRGKSTPILTKLFLLLPPAVFLLAMTVFADNMGVRYLIPALPFAYLLGGMGAGRFVRKRPRVGPLCGRRPVPVGSHRRGRNLSRSPLLLQRNGLPAGKARPDRVGRRKPLRPLWLDDSNVDWGQGLKQLRQWEDRHGSVPPLRLAYPGAFPPDSYGLRYEPFLTHQLMPEPAPGWYAVSAHLVGRIPTVGEKFQQGGGAWLRRIAPVAIVGHAFYIYEVR